MGKAKREHFSAGMKGLFEVMEEVGKTLRENSDPTVQVQPIILTEQEKQEHHQRMKGVARDIKKLKLARLSEQKNKASQSIING